MSVVENIRFICKKNNTSIPKLEKELGFGNGAIYNWDKNSPSVDKIQKVADYFSVTTDFLIFGFEREIIDTIKSLARYNEQNQLYFPDDIFVILTKELESFKEEYYDIPFFIMPPDMILLINETPLSEEFKEDFLNTLKRVKNSLTNLGFHDYLDKDTQAISEATRKMSPQQREKTIKLLKLTFDELFNDKD